jgi:endo-1,3-1,4-beta-glycanase ExoK
VLKFITVLSLSLAGLISSAHAEGSPGFVDHFERFNASRWRISDGWSNGGTFDCSFKGTNVRLEEGALSLSRVGLAPNGTCAEVQSATTYLYGTFEAQVKPAVGSGLFTSMFLFSPGGKGVPSTEIRSGILGRTALQQAVRLGIVWTPKGVTVYEDGHVVKTLGPEEAKALSSPMKIFLTAYSRKESYLGDLDTAALPARAQFDWVAYTPLGAPCQFPESLACQLAPSN